MKRAISITSILLFLLCACATTNLSWNKLTPKGRAAMALSIYNQSYDSYLAEVKNPNLSEQSKKMLRIKKQSLTALHKVLELYTTYVQAGQVPPAQIEATLQSLLAQFAVVR